MESKWILISEGKPKDGQLILAFDGRVLHCEYRQDQFQRHTINSGNDRIITCYFPNVLMWMPEPNPINTVNYGQDNGAVAIVPDYPCIVGYGDTEESALKNAIDLIKLKIDFDRKEVQG